MWTLNETFQTVVSFDSDMRTVETQSFQGSYQTYNQARAYAHLLGLSHYTITYQELS